MKRRFTIGALVVLLLALAGCKGLEQKEREPLLVQVTTERANEMIESGGDYRILEISTAEECSEEGTIENSINIDFFSEDFREQVDRLDKSAAYILFCRSGKRSAKALVIMEELGFLEVYEVEGGVYAWEEKGFKMQY